MGNGKSKRPRRAWIGYNTIWMAIGLAVLYWILESFVETLLFHEGDLVTRLFTPPPHEMWMRSFAGCLFITFGIYARFVIAQRERAEEALQKSEREKALVLSSVSELVTFQDHELKILWANRAAGESVGLSLDELVGRHCYEIWQQRNEPCAGCPVVKTLQTGEPQEAEQTSRDGRIWFIRGYPVRDENGQVIGAVEVTQEITERRRAEEALEHRLEFEGLIANISTSFINLAPDEIDAGINKTLRTIGEFADVDRSYVFQFYDGGTQMDNTHEWCAEGIEPYVHELKGVPVDEYSWSLQRIRRGEAIHIPRVADLPPEASAEKKEFEREGIQSLIMVPLAYAGAVVGFLGFDAVKEKTWTEDDIGLLRIVGEMFASALARKRAEEALRESEEKFRTLAERSPNMIFINLKGRVVYANARCEEVMGYTREEFYAADFDFLSLIAPEYREAVTASFRRHTQGEEVGLLDYALLTPDGRRIEAILATKLIDYRGERAIMGIVTDITEHKRAEEEIRSQAETLAALHETSLDLAAQRTPPELLEAIVARAVELLGAKGGGIHLYRPATDDLEYVFTYKVASSPTGTVIKRGEGISGKVLETGRPIAVDDYSQWQGRLPQFEGSGFTACVAVPICWGDHLLGVLNVDDETPRTFSPEDITLLQRFTPLAAAALENARLLEAERERRQVAEILQRASAALNSTLALGEVLGLLLQQLQEVIPYDSASVQSLRDEHLEIVACQGFADPEKVIGVVFPLDPKFPNDQVVKTREPLVIEDVTQDYPHFTKEADTYESGHVRSWLGVPLLVKDQVIGMIALDRATVQPYTREEAALALAFANQAAMAIENARLYSDLQQQMAELQDTHAQLMQSAKLAAIGELAAGVAHELSNPLTTVLGLAEIVQADVDMDAPYWRDLEVIASEAQRASKIVRNLLSFARQTKPERRPADVNRVLQQTLSVVRYHLEKSGVAIEEEYAADLGSLSLDEDQMKQVFLNLITNSSQAMPRGGTLSLRTARIGDEVAVSVRDVGMGIPAANLNRIFDPFFSTKPSGTGLGLSVSLGIVQTHGGRITVESEEGQGSTFTVWLPAGTEKGWGN